MSPAVDSATVFFGGLNNEIVAADKRTGRLLWRQSTGGSDFFSLGRNVVLAGDVAVVGDGDIRAFNRATGAPRWAFPGSEDNPGTAYLATDGLTVYAMSQLGIVYAVNALTGAQQWLTDLSGEGSFQTSGPIVSAGIVFINLIGFDGPGIVVALEAASGRLLWRRDLDDAPGFSFRTPGRPAVFASSVIVPIAGGRIHALDRTTGSTLWIAPVADMAVGRMDSRPLTVAGSVVVAGSFTGVIIGLDAATGRQLWRNQATGGSVIDTPVADLDGATVFFTFLGGQIIAISAASGSVRWNVMAGFAFGVDLLPPAVDAERLYLSAPSGYYALRK